MHGKNKCPCVGIDNLKGYYAIQQDYYHVQYPAEAGASCAAWEDGMHPKCRDGAGPSWCKQKWCYVDPCNCELDVPPKVTGTSTTYHGQKVFWSYDTCGSMDLWSQDMAADSCAAQKSQGACAKNSECSWDGKLCGDKAALKACDKSKEQDTSIHGEEDCRCVGLGGHDIGKTFMYVKDQELAEFPANVGATCGAWEMDAHPDCMKDGEKPSWCSAKWCFVDPCKCKAKVPPKPMSKANERMRFQGKTAYWSYAACGSTDTWSADHKSSELCHLEQSEAACTKIKKCAWDGKQCLGKAFVEICAKQEESGVLGLEAPLSSSAPFGSSVAILALLGAVAMA